MRGTSRFSATLRPRHDSGRLEHQPWNFANMNRKRSPPASDLSNSKTLRLSRCRVVLALPAVLLLVFIGVTQQYSTRNFLNTLRNAAAVAAITPAQLVPTKSSQSTSSRSDPQRISDSNTVAFSKTAGKNLGVTPTKTVANDSYPQLQNETAGLKGNLTNAKTDDRNATNKVNLIKEDTKDKSDGTETGTNDAKTSSTGNGTDRQNDREKDAVAKNLPIDWRLPLSMREYEPAERGSAEARHIGNHSWVQPLIISSIVRKRNESLNETDVYVYATGVTMGNFVKQNRNFSMVGCIVGTDIYAIDYVLMDVFHCVCNRAVSSGEHVSLVVRNDGAMKKALSEVTRLSLNFVRRLDDGKDVLPLPNDVKFHVENSTFHNLSDYRQIRTINASKAKLEVAADMSSKQPRYEVCLLSMMKQFLNLLDDWVDYHRKLGVDQIYILDNDALEDLSARYANRSDVEVVYWPFQRSQVQVFSMFMIGLRSRCEWLLVWDADEYIMIGIGDKKQDANTHILKRLLSKRRLEGYDELRFKYLTMAPNGHIFMPKEAVPDAYTITYPAQMPNVKSALQTDRDWILSRIHYPKGRFWPRILEMEVNPEPVSIEDGSAIVHYQFRSLEEAVLKATYGSSSIGDMNLDFSEVSKVQNMTNPLPLYTYVDERLRYTYFRDIWRAVTNTSLVQTRTVVVIVDGKRCLSTYDDSRKEFGKEKCLLQDEPA